MLTWNPLYHNGCQYITGAHQITEGFLAKNVLQATVSTQSATPCQDWRLLTTEEGRMSLQKMVKSVTMVLTGFQYQRKKHRIHTDVKIRKEDKTHTEGESQILMATRVPT